MLAHSFTSAARRRFPRQLGCFRHAFDDHFAKHDGVVATDYSERARELSPMRRRPDSGARFPIQSSATESLLDVRDMPWSTSGWLGAVLSLACRLHRETPLH
jgi:hypothetical protein